MDQEGWIIPAKMALSTRTYGIGSCTRMLKRLYTDTILPDDLLHTFAMRQGQYHEIFPLVRWNVGDMLW